MRGVWLRTLVLGVGLFLGAGEGFAFVKNRESCPPAEIDAAKELAVKVLSLSKVDPAAALKLAEEVARTKSNCYQLAFGAILDGTGTASTRRGSKRSVGRPRIENDGNGNNGNGGGNGLPTAPSSG